MPQYTLVTSHRPAILLERLAHDLGTTPLGPFDEETIVVQSLGMERWIQHELARRHGCAASLRFPFPAAFCHWLAKRLAPDGQGTDDRFQRDALTWRILDLIENGIADEAAFAPIRRFVRGDGADASESRKRLGLAARLAARFDDYQLYRHEQLLSWEQGQELGQIGSATRWQGELWRRLCTPERGPDDAVQPPMHLARWFANAATHLQDAVTPPAGLPPRVSVFGITTLPPLFVDLLRALARWIPVRLYVLAPPHATWRDDDVPNPLFAAFGHASRDLLSLCTVGATVEEHYDSSKSEEKTALARLQDDVRDGLARGREAGQHPPVVLDPRDSSLSVHVCHSELREMEVLRDQIFAAFASDATLRPHDVLLLVPDVATYAPFVEAVFGTPEPGLPRIPHHVADEPVAHESSLVDGALRILRLVGARWTAAEIVSLLELPAVRAAAGVDEDASSRIFDWVEETRIRWGRDGRMRSEVFQVPPFESNSWRAGLDRLIIGYAVGPQEALVGDVLPCAGHTIGDPEVLGAFAQWVDLLFETLDAWRSPRSLAAWAGELTTAFERFLAPEGDEEKAAFDQLIASVRELRRFADVSRDDRVVDVGVVRDWLERALSDESAGAGFLTGGMTVCALKPMRAIPFRVVAVAGLDDDSFPRSARRAPYDLLEIEHRAGDRNIRADDRQLFLDTLLSARDRLILTYVGRSARDNSERAASVVLAELLDVVDRSFHVPDENGVARRARAAVIVEHRLQPFSTAYYDGSNSRLFSYSRVNATASEALASTKKAEPFCATPLVIDSAAPLEIRLRDLIACWRNPSRFFCEHVLGLRLAKDGMPLDDCEPMVLDGLERYGIHERLLQRELAGRRCADQERAEAVASGILPAGALASVTFQVLASEIAPFLERVGQRTFLDPVSLDITGDGWRLTGRLDGITAAGRTQIRASLIKSKDLIAAWISHVALTQARGAVRSHVLGTNGELDFDVVVDPRAVLEQLIEGYRQTLQSPIPVFEQASYDWFHARHKGQQQALAAARIGYNPNDRDHRAHDLDDPYVALCWRGRDPIADAAFEQWSDTLWSAACSVLHAVDPDADEVKS